jgi:hypothetical protein
VESGAYITGRGGPPAAPPDALPGQAHWLKPVPHWPARAWLGLAAILALYALTIVWLRPAANFGSIQDDAIYFASAKAIAAGQGYILPSFPGTLAHLKYPELYPWLLSWIWRAAPHFPSNVIPAIGLSVVFGCWFLVACFLMAKKTMGLGDGWSLVVVALCAFNFFALLVGGSVLSDMPFAAMMLTAALAADRALAHGTKSTAGSWWSLAAVALAGLSVGLRSVGAAIVAGMVLIALVRRAYGRAILFGVAAGALALPWLLPALLRAVASRPQSVPPLPQGWVQTLAFYTSYVGQWRQVVPDWATQQAVCVRNFLNLASEPGILLLQPLVNNSPLLTAVGVSLTALASWAGILVRWRRTGWRAIHAILLFYIALIVPWPFPPHRFFLPFLPLVFGGLAVMARDIAAKAASEFRRSRQFETRATAAMLMLVMAALGVMAAANYVYAVPRQLIGVMAAKRSLLAEKKQAYDWIRGHTPPQASFIAYDDVLLYLYSGRQAVRAIACSTASFYRSDPAPALADAAHLGDVARQVNARYWLVSNDDFSAELDDDQYVLDRGERRILGRLPEVFRSGGGWVRIYDLRCFQKPAVAGCAGKAGDR